MKKLYAIMLMAIMAITANAADLYLVGGFNDWGNGMTDTYKFSTTDETNYTLKLNESLSGDFKIAGSGWNPQYATQSAKVQNGVPIKLQSGNTNNCTMDGSVKNPTVTFNTSTLMLTVTGEEEAVVTTYEIWASWVSASWGGVALTEKDGVWTSSEVTLTQEGEFGIKQNQNGNQSAWYSGTTANYVVTVGTPFTCVKDGGTNMKIAAGTYTFSFNPTTLVLNVTGKSTGEIDPDPTPGDFDWSGTYVNVNGNFNNWGDPGNGTLADKAGMNTHAEVAIGNGEFEIKTWNSQNGDQYYGTGGVVVANGEWIQLRNGGGHMTIANATANSSYEVVYNCATNQMKLTLVGGDTPTYPEELYVIGTLAAGSWNPTVGALMTNQGEGEYTINELKFEPGDAYFSFCTKLSSSTDDWNLGTRYMPTENDVVLAVGSSAGLMAVSDGANSFKTEKLDVLTLKVNLKTMQVTLDAASGVEGVAVDANEAVEYFNLQGVRVANPENGLFIRRQGNNISKVVIK